MKSLNIRSPSKMTEGQAWKAWAKFLEYLKQYLGQMHPQLRLSHAKNLPDHPKRQIKCSRGLPRHQWPQRSRMQQTNKPANRRIFFCYNWSHKIWNQMSIQPVQDAPTSETGRYFSDCWTWKAPQQEDRKAGRPWVLAAMTWIWTGFWQSWHFFWQSTQLLKGREGTSESSKEAQRVRNLSQTKASCWYSSYRHHSRISSLRRMLFRCTKHSTDIPV